MKDRRVEQVFRATPAPRPALLEVGLRCRYRGGAWHASKGRTQPYCRFNGDLLPRALCMD